MECLQLIVEPVKVLGLHLKDSQLKRQDEKKEPLVEIQLFIMELAKELYRVCQHADLLEHIWTGEDVWFPSLCRAFILEWGTAVAGQQTCSPPGEKCWLSRVTELLEMGGEGEVEEAKGALLCWSRTLKALPEDSVCLGERVEMMLVDINVQWKKQRLPNLLLAVELFMWAVLTNPMDKGSIPQQWLARRQRLYTINAVPYIPDAVWSWICEAAVEVTLDADSTNPDLVLSQDEKRMRCGLERRDVPNLHQRFDAWWCAVGTEGFLHGRHFWEVEVGERDWRLGVAKEWALRKGFRWLNTNSGYLSLRLERGTELKALTVPVTALPPQALPRRVAVYLDYEQGQLSFYDAQSRAHIYTFCETFSHKLYPLFGTVEIHKDLMIRSPGEKQGCVCPMLCM